MSAYRMLRRLKRAVLLVVLITFAGQPALVAAAPVDSPQADLRERLVDAGDAYLTHTGEAFVTGLRAAPQVEAIFEAPIEGISPGAIAAARRDLLELALDGSAALGAAGELARVLQDFGPNLPASVDPAENAAVPAQMRSDMQVHLGYSSAQVDAFEADLQALLAERRAVATSGLPPDVVEQLQAAGFSSGEIQTIQEGLAERGLAPTEYDSQLDQFRAARDELADGRTAALIGYVQLVLREISARQARGIAPRPVSDEELKALAQDQLRLLIHTAQLQALWGEDAALEAGEGHWWFIERYAQRAAERAEAILLQSQNPALIVDLYLALHLSTLATTARTDGADYVKAELDGLAELVAELSQGRDFLAQSRQSTRGLAKLAARLSATAPVRERVAWPVEAVQLERSRAALADRLAAPPAAEGAFAELNEDNNRLGIPIVPDLSQWGSLHPSLLDQMLASIEEHVDPKVLDFLWGVLSGKSENWIALGLNVGLSIIPVLGAIPDIISLIVDDSVFVKAVSLLGIAFSLGELLVIFGWTAPIAVGSVVGDASSAVLKIAFRNADNLVRGAVDALGFRGAFEVAWDLVMLGSRRVLEQFPNVGSSLPETRAAFEAVFLGLDGLFADFSAFVRRVDTAGLRQGVSEGSVLAGRLDRLGIALSDPAFDAVRRVGDDLAAAGVRLSDEAAEGLGRLARVVDESQLRGMTSQLPPGQIDEALGAARVWDDAAEAGFGKLAAGGYANDDLATLLARHADDQQVLDDLLGVVDESAFASWAPRHTDGLSSLLRASGGLSADAMKHMPFNALDEAFYPGFGSFLESTSEYLPDHLRAINDAAEAGDSSAVLGHLSNILGEYRETRFFQHAVDDLGHRPLFSHVDEFGTVNAPGLDGITLIEDEGVYFLAEVKDRGRAFGTIVDGPKTGSRLAPSDLSNYMARGDSNELIFNEDYFFDELERLEQVLDPGGLGILDDLENAYETGRLRVIAFAGGNADAFGPTLDALDSLAHPGRGPSVPFVKILDSQ
ncbi:MAG: hypothetical protein ACLFWD_02775 [Anaerolineales bacterium]